jgi:hypothetical protein
VSALVVLELPPLEEMRKLWSASAAVMTVLGFSNSCSAAHSRWHYDDGGGNWCDIYLLDDGKALLCGADHEYSKTYYGEAAEFFGEPETDILAGVPEWWSAAFPRPEDFTEAPYFAYGWDGRQWSRAAYTEDDGFDSIHAPGCSRTWMEETLVDLVGGAAEEEDLHWSLKTEVLDQILQSAPELTPEQLSQLVKPVEGDVAAGVAAAVRFRQ